MPQFELPSPHPPAALLTDESVELRLLRVLGPVDRELRDPASQFLAAATECRFAIHQRDSGERVGRIHLRLAADVTILRAVGHVGYETDEAHRQRGYATHALRLIRGLARHYDIAPLWVLMAPDNLASRRAAERVGFTLHDIASASVEALALGLDAEVCRYIIERP